MTDWSALDAELSHWRDDNRVPALWWRDDDAADTTPALDRLIGLRRRLGVPLALAVVPATATAALAARLAGESQIDLLQHGYAHVNHAPPAEKKCELGTHRPAMMVLGDLGSGWMAMERLFGARPLKVLVPPWNRIAPGLVPALPEIGFAGLSVFGPRKRREPVKGLLQINTHVDVIDWRGARGFVGREAVLGQLVEALAAARTLSDYHNAEPVGVLSHHLAMDERAWDFLSLLWDKLIEQGVKTSAAHELFASREARV